MKVRSWNQEKNRRQAGAIKKVKGADDNQGKSTTSVGRRRGNRNLLRRAGRVEGGKDRKAQTSTKERGNDFTVWGPEQKRGKEGQGSMQPGIGRACEKATGGKGQCTNVKA